MNLSLRWLLPVTLLALTACLHLSAASLTTVINFDDKNGRAPREPLVAGPDGTIYGFCEGGKNSLGTVFKIAPNGAFSNLISFTGGNGSVPSYLVLTEDGTVYGATSQGGKNGLGTVFKITPEGHFSSLISFNGTNGMYPNKLVVAPDGTIYGRTFSGGIGYNGSSQLYGTIFKISPAGAFTSLVSFNGDNGVLNGAGGNPGALIVGADGTLHGTATSGGSKGQGTVFKISPQGVFTRLANFEGQNGNGFYTNRLVASSDGSVYGTTLSGGGSIDGGTIFKINPQGVFKSLVVFTGANGVNPHEDLIEGADGKLYGTTELGGPKGFGTVFKVSPSGVLTTIAAFDGNNGHDPDHLALGTDGTIFGVLGKESNNGNIVFKITSAGGYTPLASFGGQPGISYESKLTRAENGTIYGSIQYNDGGNRGLVFKIAPKGALTPLAYFGGADPAYFPNPSLVINAAGVVYGTTTLGGTKNFGTVWKISPQDAQTIAFSSPGTQTYGAVPIVFDATASSGLPVTYNLVSGPATLSGDRLTLTGVGTIKVAADQPGDDAFLAAPRVTISFTVKQASQTITFPVLRTAVVGETLPLAATASSGLPVTYSVISGSATIVGSSVKVTGKGTVTLAADQPGNANYLPARQVKTSFVVKEKQTITFPAIANQPYGVPFSPGATASSGLTVSYKIVSGPAKVSGSKLTFSGLGKVVLQGKQAGNTTYAAAPVVTVSFSVVKGTQTITLPQVANQVVGASPITLLGTASSGLPVTYKVTGPATISGSVVTVNGAGSVRVGAYQAGNAFYSAAPNVQITFKVSKQAQKITFPAVGAVKVGQVVTLGATSSSGLPITYTATGPVSLSGNKATFTAKGTVKFTANQPGNETYAKAAAVNVNATVK